MAARWTRAPRDTGEYVQVRPSSSLDSDMDVVGSLTREEETRDGGGAGIRSATPEDAEPGLSRVTIVALWSVVAVFLVITLARSAAVDVPIRDPGGKLVLERL